MGLGRVTFTTVAASAPGPAVTVPGAGPAAAPATVKVRWAVWVTPEASTARTVAV